MKRYNVYKEAKEQISEIYTDIEHIIVIHYSCESIYKDDGTTPRITAIALKFANSGQQKFFSIHQQAEITGLLNNIDVHYNELEKAMLKDFFVFADKYKNGYRWVNWHMNNASFGFDAIENRARCLGLTYRCSIIKDHLRFDVSELLKRKYGHNYCKHPRLYSILELNNITPPNLLSGEDESEAFENKQFLKLQNSTIAKVDGIARLLERDAVQGLKTSSGIFDQYGVSMQGMYEYAKEKWWWGLLTFILGLIVGILNKE